MILADASVWIDFLRDRSTPEVDRLLGLLDSDQLALADLTLTEVLQGVRSEANFHATMRLLGDLPMIEVVGRDIAVTSARHYRFLRSRGITIRKTIDMLIATRCIEDGHALLYSDRDFDPFVAHLGLVSAMAD